MREFKAGRKVRVSFEATAYDHVGDVVGVHFTVGGRAYYYRSFPRGVLELVEQPEPEVGAVITFNRVTHITGEPYRAVATRVDRPFAYQWYVTGLDGAKSWDELKKLMTDGEFTEVGVD